MLYNDFLTNEQKPIWKWTHYFPAYERHFKKFVNQSVILYEIGVFRGGSLQMWKRYFGPFARIIAIDINPHAIQHKEDQIEICIGDQSDTVFLQSVIDKYGRPDIVVDDGSHIPAHQRASFDFLYDKLTKNGVYLIEDLDIPRSNGEKSENSFIEHCKDLIESLNARHNFGNRGFIDSTYCMSFYNSIVVFEKAELQEDSYKSLMIPDRPLDVALLKMSNGDTIKKQDLIDRYVVLFGAGANARNIVNAINCGSVVVKYFVDNDTSKHGSFINGIEVISPSKALETRDCVYVITCMDDDMRDSIFKQLTLAGVDKENLYWAIFQ